MRSDQRKVVRLSMPAGPSTAPPTPTPMPPELLRLLRWFALGIYLFLWVCWACGLYWAYRPQWDHPRPTEPEIFPPTDTRSE